MEKYPTVLENVFLKSYGALRTFMQNNPKMPGLYCYHVCLFRQLQMIKSELIALLAAKQSHLSGHDVMLAVNCIIEHLSATLANGERIEVRGFGSFALHRHDARIGRNPKTGEVVGLPPRYAVHFKPGMDMRHKIDASRSVHPKIKDV